MRRTFSAQNGQNMAKIEDHDRPGKAPDLFEGEEPFTLFDAWMADALAKEVNDPNAMALATVDRDGLPNVRMVLLKGVEGRPPSDGDNGGPRGFVFYTNLESHKGLELASEPRAAICFHWKSLRRQVRARGTIEPVTDEEADAYFSTRHRQSQIGAWASAQSRPLEGRFELERAVAKYAARYAVGSVPRPPHWSGFRLVPTTIEFWRDRPFRLHDRLLFSRDSDRGGGWEKTRLYP